MSLSAAVLGAASCIVSLSIAFWNEIIPRFLHDTESWIFSPKTIEISVSADGKNFKPLDKIATDTDIKSTTIQINEYKYTTDGTKIRFIKINAENIGTCPDWHIGAGGDAWLFIDEIVVK